MPYPCPVPIDQHWHLEDGDDGWYVVSPGGDRSGPYSEAAAERKCAELRRRFGSD